MSAWGLLCAGGGCWPQAKSCSIAPTPVSQHQGSTPSCGDPPGAPGTPRGLSGTPQHPVSVAGCSATPSSACPTGWAEPPGPMRCFACRDGKVFQVLLGAHSLTEPEPHKRLYRVRAQIPHPGSNIHNNKDDLLLLQVGYRDPFPSPTGHGPAPANPSAPWDLVGELTATGGNP